MWIRHFFNLRHRGEVKPLVLIGGLVAFLAIMVAIAPWSELEQRADSASLISDEQAMKLIDLRCTECHSSNPRSNMFSTAPAGYLLDTLAQVQLSADKIRTRAVVNKDMPLGNLTQMTQAERDQLGQWLLALAR
jgi:uncharacterized membrane protein